MAKNYMNEIKRKRIKQRCIIKEEMKNKDRKKLKTKKRSIKESTGPIKGKRREEKILTFQGEGDFKKVDFKKFGFNWNEKVIDKTQYSNRATKIAIMNWKNDIYINKNYKNKKDIFTNHFKYVKGKKLYYYMNIIILIIIIYSMNSSYIELTIPGPGISRIFFENTGKIYNRWCPSTIFPDEILINCLSPIGSGPLHQNIEK